MGLDYHFQPHHYLPPQNHQPGHPNHQLLCHHPLYQNHQPDHPHQLDHHQLLYQGLLRHHRLHHHHHHHSLGRHQLLYHFYQPHHPHHNLHKKYETEAVYQKLFKTRKIS